MVTKPKKTQNIKTVIADFLKWVAAVTNFANFGEIHLIAPRRRSGINLQN